MAGLGQTDGSGSSVETLLVGVDAGCRSVLAPLAEADAIPNLQRVFESGVAGPLESQIPPWTPSAWPSLYTGVNPGKHGVYGFLAFDGYDWDVVNATHVRERTLWNLLDRHGKSSVVVNAPVTFPPREFDGALVPGYTAPEDPDCHPDGLLDEIRDEIGEYRIYAPRDVSDDRENVEWYRRLIRMRGAAFRCLVSRFDPAFGFVQFQQTDTVFHEFPGDDAKVRAVYEAVDRQVGEILDACNPDTVILASDHGIGEYTGYEFRPNEFLRERGLVEVTKGGEGPPVFGTIVDNQLRAGKAGKADDESSLVERGLTAIVKRGVNSRRIRSAVKVTGLADVLVQRIPDDTARAAIEQVDFPASVAYMRDRIELGVRVNLRDREPDGVVPESEYDRVCEELVSMLSDVETPDGEPVFERVSRREEVFSGPYVDEAPDVITIPREYDEFLSIQVGDGQFGPPSEPYSHKRDGIVALAGDGVDASANFSRAHLFDVAPTILATMGVPASDRMDGTVLPVVESAGASAYPPLAAGERETTDDGDEVEARLADLGYLE